MEQLITPQKYVNPMIDAPKEDYQKKAEEVARKKAIQHWQTKCLKEGRDGKFKEDFIEGFIEGWKEGIAIILKATSLLKKGLSVPDVCKETGLSEDIVRALQS